MFRYLRRCDDGLVALNLLLLLFVAFLPFPVALFGSFRRDPVAIGWYATSMGLTGLSLNLLWWYAAGRHRLVAPDLDRRIVRYIQFQAALRSHGAPDGSSRAGVRPARLDRFRIRAPGPPAKSGPVCDRTYCFVAGSADRSLPAAGPCPCLRRSSRYSAYSSGRLVKRMANDPNQSPKSSR